MNFEQLDMEFCFFTAGLNLFLIWYAGVATFNQRMLL
jgi:hypothetical protein